MRKNDPKVSSPAKSERELTLKQSRFATAYPDPNGANGNGVAACKTAGYSGSANSLAVQASANLRDPRIRRRIAEALDAQGCTVECATRAVAEAMQATKRRGLLNKEGKIIYTDSEPDHKIRLHAAAMRLHLEVASLSEELDEEESEVGRRADSAGQEASSSLPQADPGELHGPVTEDLGSLNPADRLLFEKAIALDGELIQLDREQDDGSDGHDTDE